MPATATTLTRSTQEAINTLSPGDRRVLNEIELAQRWGIRSSTLEGENGGFFAVLGGRRLAKSRV